MIPPKSPLSFTLKTGFSILLIIIVMISSPFYRYADLCTSTQSSLKNMVLKWMSFQLSWLAQGLLYVPAQAGTTVVQ